jgi:hypothetical protein
VTVLRKQPDGSPVFGTCQADAHGGYRIEDLEPGEYILCALSESCPLAQRTPFAIPAGVRSFRQDVVLETGCLFVKVVDGESGEPVAGAAVMVGPPGAAPPKPGLAEFLGKGLEGHGESRPTNRDGEIEIDLPPDRYGWSLRHPGYAPSDSQEVVIESGVRSTAMARLLPCGWLDVRVRRADGENGLTFELEYRREGATDVQHTHGFLGRHELRGLGRGAWRLRVRSLHVGSKFQWGPEQRVVIEARGRQEVELVAGQ